jgi:hypothetical protein
MIVMQIVRDGDIYINFYLEQKPIKKQLDDQSSPCLSISQYCINILPSCYITKTFISPELNQEDIEKDYIFSIFTKDKRM